MLTLRYEPEFILMLSGRVGSLVAVYKDSFIREAVYAIVYTSQCNMASRKKQLDFELKN